MPTDPDRSKALRLFQHWAKSRRATLGEKAAHEFQGDYGREADPEDLWDAVCAASEAHIRSVEPDDQIGGNTVIILAVPLLGREAYIKATMNLDIDHNVYVLSCKLRRK